MTDMPYVETDPSVLAKRTKVPASPQGPLGFSRVFPKDACGFQWADDDTFQVATPEGWRSYRVKGYGSFEEVGV